MRTIGTNDKKYREIAPCLADSPYAESARRLVEESDRLGKNKFASTMRAWSVWYMFNLMEGIFAREDEPASNVDRGFGALANFLAAAVGLGLNTAVLPEINGQNGTSNAKGDVKEVTGDHYGHLFKEFSDLSYWDEPVMLLKERLERNGIPVGDVENKSVLDAGCGGGRYSVAWRLLGAGPVTGLDISPINVEDANRRIKLSEIDRVSFKQGDVLELPFDDDLFDIVFSNGVLHHTTDWQTGVNELVRVLKPGGLGWLYLIENPGGLFWDVIEILRVMLRDENKADIRSALLALHLPANRIFYMLDHVMVPINVRLSPKEIMDALENAGATDIRRLTRGYDFDRVEQIYRDSRYAREYFGVGENRFVFSK
jgi:ubiquinone/menaquinone biosynthesis C-methylase UbiE